MELSDFMKKHGEKYKDTYLGGLGLNISEIKEELYEFYLNSPDYKIAVITPYKGQVRLIKHIAKLEGFDLGGNNIVVNTVDAFQGDEAEIVFFCTTRRKKLTDFFTDYRRINVAFSRTKRQLFIIGSLKYFDRYSRYKGGQSPLPSISKYIKNNGNVKIIRTYN